MKKLLFLAILVAGIYACTRVIKTTSTNASYYCGTGSGNVPCSSLPLYVNELITAGYTTNEINFTDTASAFDSTKQTPLDLFSWQTFIALNWPSDPNGKPMSCGLGDSAGALRVWEHYQDPLEAFNLPKGELVLHLGEARQSGDKYFYMASKAPRDLFFTDLPVNDFEESVDNKPLIDRYLNFTLYEVKLNDVEANFIQKNGLNTVAGIYKYTKGNPNTFALPATDSSAKNTSPGSIEIKASWRIMTAQDNANNYYCRNAIIFIDSAHTVNHRSLIIRNVKVGLVGMHIIRNSEAVAGPDLIWSTFEQEDNCPDSGASAKKTYSYFNPDCTNCKLNAAPPHIPIDGKKYIWDTVQPYAQLYKDSLHGYGTQVVRTAKVFKYTDSVNNKFRKAIAGTVWEHYRLIGTQWQHGDGGPGTSISAPPLLANTTMETYIQGKSSCITCHGGANVVYTDPSTGKTDTIKTGLSFLFPFYAHSGLLHK